MRSFDSPALHLLLFVPEVSDYLGLLLIHTIFYMILFVFPISISIQVNNTLESAWTSVVGRRVFINKKSLVIIINKSDA